MAGHRFHVTSSFMGRRAIVYSQIEILMDPQAVITLCVRKARLWSLLVIFLLRKLGRVVFRRQC